MTADTVLLITTSYDFAAEYVIKALEERSVPYFKFDTDRFPSQIRIGFKPPVDLVFDNGTRSLYGCQVKSVWYRRNVDPELPEGLDTGVSEFCIRETKAFLSGVLSTLETIRWLSSPQAITIAESKPYQLHKAVKLGFLVPDTVITNNEILVRELANRYKLVAKAVSSGYVESDNGNKAIFTSAITDSDIGDLAGLELAPVTFQERLDKASDIRVTVVGDIVFAAEILSQARESSRIDWRATDDPNIDHLRHSLPPKIEDLCRKLVQQFSLAFGAIDLVKTKKGEYIFLELNPNGEWVWIEDRLRLPISHQIAKWLDGQAS